MSRHDPYFLSVKWKALNPKSQAYLDQIDQAIMKDQGGERKSTENIIINDDNSWDVYLHYSDTPDTRYTFKPNKADALELDSVTRSNSQLGPEQLSKSKALKLKGANGNDLTALLTLPKNNDSAIALPVVVMPHGGPEHHFSQAYDHNVQFLANRGFAVLQLNHSGSTGHGKELIEDIHQNFKLAAQDTISMTKDAISQGLISDESLSIFGHSFGGYTALKATELAPEMFDKSIAYNAPIIPWTKLGNYILTTDRIPHDDENIEPRQSHADSVSFVKAQDGSDDIDLSKIQTPTSFMFSSQDDNKYVPLFNEAKTILEQMQTYHELNEFEGEGHVFREQSSVSKQLTRIEGFLKRELPQTGLEILPIVNSPKESSKTQYQGMKNEWSY